MSIDFGAKAPSVTELVIYVEYIKSLLENATYGLAALKVLIDAVEGKLDALPAERGTDDAELESDAGTRHSALVGYVDEIESLLKNVTYGLSALKALIDAVEGKLDAPEDFKADLSGVLSKLDDIEGKLDALPAERGTDNAELEADASDRFDKLRQKATGPAWDQDTDSLEAIRELLGVVEHETEWAADAHCDSVSSDAETNLTVGALTPTFPTGSTRVRAILVASIHVLNEAANTHHIAFKVEGNKDAGAYSDLLDLTATAQLGLVNLDGSTDAWSGAIDVTALVDASGSAYNFRFVVTSDNAGAVRYITCFTLVLVYHM